MSELSVPGNNPEDSPVVHSSEILWAILLVDSSTKSDSKDTAPEETRYPNSMQTFS